MVAQSQQLPGRIPVEGQPLLYFMCGSPHMKMNHFALLKISREMRGSWLNVIEISYCGGTDSSLLRKSTPKQPTRPSKRLRRWKPQRRLGPGRTVFQPYSVLTLSEIVPSKPVVKPPIPMDPGGRNILLSRIGSDAQGSIALDQCSLGTQVGPTQKSSQKLL